MTPRELYNVIMEEGGKRCQRDPVATWAAALLAGRLADTDAELDRAVELGESAVERMDTMDRLEISPVVGRKP